MRHLTRTTWLPLNSRARDAAPVNEHRSGCRCAFAAGLIVIPRTRTSFGLCTAVRCPRREPYAAKDLEGQRRYRLAPTSARGATCHTGGKSVADAEPVRGCASWPVPPGTARREPYGAKDLEGQPRYRLCPAAERPRCHECHASSASRPTWRVRFLHCGVIAMPLPDRVVRHPSNSARVRRLSVRHSCRRTRAHGARRPTQCVPACWRGRRRPCWGGSGWRGTGPRPGAG
jgi:hypothetical protein